MSRYSDAQGNPNQAPRPFAAQPGWQALGTPPPAVPLPPGGGTGGGTGGGSVDISTLLTAVEAGNATLAAILAELRGQVAQGVAYATTVVWNTLVIQEVPFPAPLFTLSITNDGPQIIQYRMPNASWANFINLAPTEVIQFNFIKGLIPSVGLRLATLGVGVTTVRLVGTY